MAQIEKTVSFIQKILGSNLNTIDAGYKTYSLQVVKGLKEGEQKCYGLTDFDLGKLSIEKEMDDQLARETLLHELMHIAFELTGLGGEEMTGLVAEQTNEELTTRATRGILLLMNLNKELFEVILNEHK